MTGSAAQTTAREGKANEEQKERKKKKDEGEVSSVYHQLSRL